MNEMVPNFQASITQTWIYRIVQLTTEYVHLLLSIYLSHTYILLHTCLYRKMNTPEVSRKTCIFFMSQKSRGPSPSRYQPNDRPPRVIVWGIREESICLFLSLDILQCKTVLSDTQQMRVSRSFFMAFVTGIFVGQSLITLLGFLVSLYLDMQQFVIHT